MCIHFSFLFNVELKNPVQFYVENVCRHLVSNQTDLSEPDVITYCNYNMPTHKYEITWRTLMHQITIEHEFLSPSTTG